LTSSKGITFPLISAISKYVMKKYQSGEFDNLI
jgi:hypothetical protein